MAEAGEHWLKIAESNGLERTTVEHYHHLLKGHIVPFLGAVKLSRLTAPIVKDFRARLLEGAPAPGEAVGTPRSPSMVTRVVRALSMLLSDAMDGGLVAQNVVKSLSRKKKRSKAQQRRKLRVGVDIPTPAEVRAIAGVLEGRWRPLILTALFTGLRASELRGLTWANVDLEKGELHVRQRADIYKTFAAPKSEAGERTVPLTPTVLTELRKRKLACPKGPLGLVFPSGAGNVEFLVNIINRGWQPAQIAAGVCTVVKDSNGQVVQERLGHSTIAMTMDTYGHLFPRGDDREELAAAEAHPAWALTRQDSTRIGNTKRVY